MIGMCKRVGNPSFFQGFGCCCCSCCLLVLLCSVCLLEVTAGKGVCWLVVDLPRVVGSWERQMMIMMLSYALLIL